MYSSIGPSKLRFSRLPSPSYRTFISLTSITSQRTLPWMSSLCDPVSFTFEQALEPEGFFHLLSHWRHGGTCPSQLPWLVSHENLNGKLALLFKPFLELTTVRAFITHRLCTEEGLGWCQLYLSFDLKASFALPYNRLSCEILQFILVWSISR
jgi:hypothetical protein